MYGFLEVLQIPPGSYMLQSAAGSVLGRQLIALAKHRGIRTINLVRRPEQKQELLDLGCVRLSSKHSTSPVPCMRSGPTQGSHVV